MSAIEVKEAGTVNCYAEGATPVSSHPPFWTKKKILFGITIIAALSLGFLVGYQLGNGSRIIYCDTKKISVSKNGTIHNQYCPYFRENKLIDCEVCGGLNGK